MIDDELLQELLTKASALYNDGDYKGAIGAWNEALQVDPSSKKAGEGIRMATLLLGDWEPPAEVSAPAAATEQPSDGAPLDAGSLTPDETTKKRDEGITAVKTLLAERRYPEAVEGARKLVPIDPESEEIQKILEEAQQAFEASPFIDEQLTLAKELFAQERYPEAKVQCEKIFALDSDHPEGAALLELIRARTTVKQRPIPGAGGSTVKMSLHQIESSLADEAAPVAEEAAPPQADAVPGQAAPEPVEVVPGEVPDLEVVEIPDTSLEGVDLSAPEPEIKPGATDPETETVEARTVVQPSVRQLSKAAPAGGGAPPAAQAVTPAPAPEAVEPAPREPLSSPETTAWETELTHLNLKAGERSILGADAARVDDASPGAGVDEAELMASLDDELGGVPPMGEGGARDEIGDVESIPLAVSPAEEGEAATPAPSERKKSAKPEAKSAPPEEIAEAHERSKVPIYSAVLGVALLAVLATGWWYFFHPRSAAGAGSPTQPTAPPPDSSVSGATGSEPGPIPTPIGGSRQTVAEGGKTAPNSVPDAADGEPAGDGTAPDGAAGVIETPAAGVTAAAGLSAPIPTADGELPRTVRDDESPPSSPENIRARVESHVATARIYMKEEHWGEATRELDRALRLFPDDFAILELLAQAQSKLDEKGKINADAAAMLEMFKEKDYRNALWKLYRLPRDQGLGDINLFIRNTWYNWAVVSIRAGDIRHAQEYLDEALAVDPGDAGALDTQRRLKPFQRKPKDRAYLAFARELRLREIDKK